MDTTTAASILPPTVANEQLQKITDDIFDLGFNMRLVAKQIAAKVAYVRENAESLCNEFDAQTPAKRFEVWGTQILGLKRAQLNAFAKVGKELLLTDGTVNILPSVEAAVALSKSEISEKEFKSLHDDSQQFTMTQLQALVPLGREKVEQLVYDGQIKPTMTVQEIKDVVSENDPKKKAKEAAKKKREKDKEEKAKERQKVHGKTLATIKINQLENESFVVTLDGEDITKTNVGRYLIKNLCK